MNPEPLDPHIKRGMQSCTRRIAGLRLATNIVPVLRKLSLRPDLAGLNRTADRLERMVASTFASEKIFAENLRAGIRDREIEDLLEVSYRLVTTETEFLEAVQRDEGL